MTSSLDDIAPAFKAAATRWPDAPNIQAQYADLASTFEGNGSSLVELCKSFLEMVCITIVTELGKDLPASSRPTTTEYLGCALDALGIRNQRGSSALGTILSGYNKLSNGLSDIRNQEGSVGHGEEAVPEPEPAEKPEEAPVGHKEPLTRKLQPVTDYQGKYAEQVSPLYDFIFHSILGGNSEYATQIQNLTYTLLNGMEDMAVIDWSKRTSTHAEVRLFLKKLTKLFSIEEIEESSIDRIVEWLAKRIPGGEA